MHDDATIETFHTLQPRSSDPSHTAPHVQQPHLHAAPPLPAWVNKRWGSGASAAHAKLDGLPMPATASTHPHMIDALAILWDHGGEAVAIYLSHLLEGRRRYAQELKPAVRSELEALRTLASAQRRLAAG